MVDPRMMNALMQFLMQQRRQTPQGAGIPQQGGDPMGYMFPSPDMPDMEAQQPQNALMALLQGRQMPQQSIPGLERAQMGGQGMGGGAQQPDQSQGMFNRGGVPPIEPVSGGGIGLPFQMHRQIQGRPRGMMRRSGFGFR